MRVSDHRNFRFRRSCNELYVASSVPGLGPYDGSDDTLVGILNSTSATLNSASLTGQLTVFAFEGDGACRVVSEQFRAVLAPRIQAAMPPQVLPSVELMRLRQPAPVNFSPGLAPGGSTWFSL